MTEDVRRNSALNDAEASMAAYGLYSHIQSNRRRSIALLIGLFFLVYVLVYAGALVGEALTVNADLDILCSVPGAISSAPRLWRRSAPRCGW